MNLYNKQISIFRRSYGLIQTMGVFLILVIILSIFLPRFMTFTNIINVLNQLSANLVVSAGMTVIILTAEFDISVGAVLALTACLAALLMPDMGILPAVGISLFIGPLFGLLHGVIVTKGKIPSFIITLGTMMIARGLAFLVTGGKVVSGIPDGFKILGQGTIKGLPIVFFVVIIVYTLGYILLKKSPFGKKIYAVGANRQVAMLSGINADKIKIIAFVAVGFSASFGGILLLSRLMSVQAYTAQGMEFDCIAAVVIGGTSLTGGAGNILRTIIGVLIIGMIRNALNLAHIDVQWQMVANGSIIILAVLLDALRRRLNAT
jgi:ribose transport system permease protein